MKKNRIGLYSLGMVAALGIVVAPTVNAEDAVGSPAASTAEFQIDPTPGTLELKEVPSFDFGIVTGTDVFEGFADRAATTAGNIVIDETRLGDVDWELSATMTQFTGADATLEGANIALPIVAGSLPGVSTLGVSLTDSEVPVQIASTETVKGLDNTFTYDPANVLLTIGGNRGATLTAGETFTSTITWSLTSTSPTAPPA